MLKIKIGTPFWFLTERNTKAKARWSFGDEDYLAVGNCFWEESDCDDEILRRESMANRIAEPKIGANVWLWSFSNNEAWCANYGKTWFSDWFIGALHTSEENCEAWHKKSGAAFENLTK